MRIVADFPTHDVAVGEITETHCDNTCQTNRKVDWAKVRPIFFTGNNGGYWQLGEYLGKMSNPGKKVSVK